MKQNTAPMILGPDGTPLMVSTPDLERQQARARLVSTRSSWAQQIESFNLTPAKLRQIYQCVAGDGDMEAYARLAEEIEERDAHYIGVLGQRKRAVAKREFVVSAASDDALDMQIADEVRNILKAADMRLAKTDMLDGIGKGYSLTEIIWQHRAGKLTPASYSWVDTRWILFDRDDARTPYLIADFGNGDRRRRYFGDPPTTRTDSEPLHPAKYIYHTPKRKSGIPARGGLALTVSVLYMLKNFSVRDWWSFAEIAGIPIRVGKYDNNASADDIATLRTAIGNLASDAGCTIPESMQIDFVNPAGGNGAMKSELFENAARWCDEQISKAVVGQTMTSDDGSSLSQSQTHMEVLDDITDDDAAQLAAAVEQQLVRYYVELNYGIGTPLPSITLPAEDNEDSDKFLERCLKMQKLGLPLSRKDTYRRAGMVEPSDDDDTIDAPQQAAMPAMRQGGEGDDSANLMAGFSAVKSVLNAAAITSKQRERLERVALDAQGDTPEEVADNFLHAAMLLNFAAPKLVDDIALALYAERVGGEVDED